MDALNYQTFTNMTTSSTINTMEHNHPAFGHLTLLVLEAVLEVVCIALPGYLVARAGIFDSDAQKVMANLNITLFTPCLIFSKLAKQLSVDTLEDLVVIPFILGAQTFFSWVSAQIAVRMFRLRKKPQKNFVTAMAVFGNSNSLPISLTVSLAHTISGLHWDQRPGDDDDSVAARGILYLLVFSQLGQALRWSWGMNSLLKPLEEYSPEERGDLADAENVERYTDETPPGSPLRLTESIEQSDGEGSGSGSTGSPIADGTLDTLAARTTFPKHGRDLQQQRLRKNTLGDLSTEIRTNIRPDGVQSVMRRVSTATSFRRQTRWKQCKIMVRRGKDSVVDAVEHHSTAAFRLLPLPIQKAATRIWKWVAAVLSKIWACMNVPLMAIIVSVFVALVAPVQAFFFTPDTFVYNSVTSAIDQSGGVAIPLILVILGGNLAGNTLPDEEDDLPDSREERNMLIASLVCRMIVPTVCMAPILALAAKYVPISTLDDPIFLIVCFLLNGAPSALQLAQMCQVNGVYVQTVSNLLFQGYVVWIMPSTLILVMLALEVVEFAAK